MKLDYLAIIKQAWDLLLKNVKIIAILIVVLIVIGLVEMFVSGLVINLVPSSLTAYILSLAMWAVNVFFIVGIVKILLGIVDAKNPQINELWLNSKYYKDAILVALAVIGIRLVFELLIALGITLPFLFFISIIVFVVMVYVLLRLWFSMYYVVDKGMDGVLAIKASWEKTKGSVVDLVILLVIIFVLLFLGALALGIGLFVTVPLSMLIFTVTYRKFQS